MSKNFHGNFFWTMDCKETFVIVTSQLACTQINVI